MSRERAESDVERLLHRIRSGDRQAAAEFVVRFGPKIRRRVRGKLGPHVRRVFDSTDILSTVGRRLDRFVRSGRLRAATEGEMWSLIFRIATCAVADKAKLVTRLEHSDVDRQRALDSSATSAGEPAALELERAFECLPDETDRSILQLWLMENDHKAIADQIGVSEAAVRKRWQRIRAKLRESLTEAAD